MASTQQQQQTHNRDEMWSSFVDTSLKYSTMMPHLFILFKKKICLPAYWPYTTQDFEDDYGPGPTERALAQVYQLAESSFLDEKVLWNMTTHAMVC